MNQTNLSGQNSAGARGPGLFLDGRTRDLMGGPLGSLPSLKSSVNRVAWDGTDLGQEQRISIETALQLYTREGAEISGFEGIGQLRTGYIADFIVLDRDILEIPSEEIDTVQVEKTFISGELKFDRRS